MLSFTLPLTAFVLGCALQLQQRLLDAASVYMLFSALGFAGAALIAIKLIALNSEQWHNISGVKRGSVLLMLSVMAALLGFGQAGWRASSFASQAIDAALEGRDVRLTGIVAAMPQRDESGIRFRFDVESAQILGDGQARPVNLPPRIQLAWYRSLPRLSEDASNVPFAELQATQGDIKAGERWQLVARLKAPHGNMNPHGFDYELWLWEQGIGATGYIRAAQREIARGDGPLMIGDTWQHPMEAARQKVQDAIFSKVASPQLAGVIAALAVGDQAAIDRADWDVYRATGVAHLMSISGLHITMFAWGAALLIGSVWRRSMRLTAWLPAQHAALIGGVLLAAAYALFAGWGVPAQRTIWMLGLAALLKLSGRRWPWPLAWLFVLALIVAIDPWALLSAGFWLSFVAVGILFASEMGTPRGSRTNEPSNLLQKAWQRLQNMLREQWVITLALAPLSLMLFNEASIVGLLANALAIPWVTLIVTPLAMAGVIAPPLWELAAFAVQGMSAVLGWIAQFPYATISIASSAGLIKAGALIGSLLFVLKLPVAVRFAGAVMIVPFVLYTAPRPPQGEFTLLAADIGQGNALLLQTANHSLLYDAGPRFSRESDAGQRTLVPLLRALGEKIDLLVVSHRDADHIGGAAAVLKMQPQAKLLSSIEAGNELQTVRAAERCIAGQKWQWDGVDFEILHPQSADYEFPQKPNAMSCVLRISNGRQTALLTGDLEAGQEQRLVSEGAALKADLLLVPHHGSKTSSTPEFLDAAKPRIAIVQSGYRNRFQHPVPEVMARYEERKIRVFKSLGCGAARWQSDAPQHVRCQREMERRYWHHRLH